MYEQRVMGFKFSLLGQNAFFFSSQSTPKGPVCFFLALVKGFGQGKLSI